MCQLVFKEKYNLKGLHIGFYSLPFNVEISMAKKFSLTGHTSMANKLKPLTYFTINTIYYIHFLVYTDINEVHQKCVGW